MAVSIGLKIGAGLLAAAGIGGGGYLIIKSNEPTNLGERLLWEGFSLLNTEDNTDIHKSEWEKIVKLYESQSNNWKINNKTLIAPSGEHPTDHSSNIQQLKQECKNLLKTDLKETDISEKEKTAKNWCILGAKGSLDKN